MTLGIVLYQHACCLPAQTPQTGEIPNPLVLLERRVFSGAAELSSSFHSVSFLMKTSLRLTNSDPAHHATEGSSGL